MKRSKPREADQAVVRVDLVAVAGRVKVVPIKARQGKVAAALVALALPAWAAAPARLTASIRSSA